ncbi:MAG: site-2 protease family protein [Gammaproteobacteria bacterium]|jgi:Zn-dependent protease
MDPLVIIGIAAVVIPSITSHEAAHGFAADRLGDPTARSLGRLTLNPIPHIDPVFTILIPALLLFMGSPILFGGAKPVPVNVHQLRNPRRDWAIVGAAGPLTNLLLALMMSVTVAVLALGLGVRADSVLIASLSVGIYFNVLLCVFNLVPIPPLDGSRVFQLFLSGTTLRAYQRLEQYGLFVIVALIFFFPPALRLLASLVRELTLAVTLPFGVASIVDTGLQSLFR